MPRITAIKPQKTKKRVNIYLDGKFGFGIDLDNFVKEGLKVEQELKIEEINEIVKKAEFAKTLEKLLSFAMLRPRSEKEINDWLKRKKVHESIHEDLFNRLNHYDLMDDEKFANWWVGQRESFRPRSKRMLQSELIKKGIDRNIIKKTLESSGVDEKENAKKLLLKKRTKWEKLDEDVAKKKKSEYLARQGFSWDVIKSCI